MYKRQKVTRAIAGHPQDVTTNGVAASRCTSRVPPVDLSYTGERLSSLFAAGRGVRAAATPDAVTTGWPRSRWPPPATPSQQVWRLARCGPGASFRRPGPWHYVQTRDSLRASLARKASNGGHHVTDLAGFPRRAPAARRDAPCHREASPCGMLRRPAAITKCGDRVRWPTTIGIGGLTGIALILD